MPYPVDIVFFCDHRTLMPSTEIIEMFKAAIGINARFVWVFEGMPRILPMEIIQSTVETWGDSRRVAGLKYPEMLDKLEPVTAISWSQTTEYPERQRRWVGLR